LACSAGARPDWLLKTRTSHSVISSAAATGSHRWDFTSTSASVICDWREIARQVLRNNFSAPRGHYNRNGDRYPGARRIS